MAAPVLNSLREALANAAHADGGWPYRAGGAHRLEPTGWALLALGAQPEFDGRPHWNFLARCQQPSGLLVDLPGLPANLCFNAIAATAWLHHAPQGAPPVVRPILDALSSRAGLQVAQSPSFRQDNSLRGWPWIEGTFSWVEPTAWAIIALKTARKRNLAPPSAGVRIAEGERMLIDRCCREGGWNYGNSNALGKELAPYVATTALVLLALQDRRQEPTVARSLDFLARQWRMERSTMTLALTALCFSRLGVEHSGVQLALAEQFDMALTLGHLHAVSAALLAATPGPTDVFSL